MEEQPRDRPPERHYPRHHHNNHHHHHAEDRPSAPDLNGVKHEQIHVQHQETQAKKTGWRKHPEKLASAATANWLNVALAT